MRVLLIAVLIAVAHAVAHPCQKCHPAEVAGYTRSGMAKSLRKAGNEPAGTVVNGSGAEIDAFSNADGSRQTLKQNGSISEYRISYAVGSGNHSIGYLVKLGDHLFQSPIAYYPEKHAYALAPGYESIANPDFTRPVSASCLFCHSGKSLPIRGAENRYESQTFEQEAISCERCHGPTEQHLLRPSPGSIVNPLRLERRARDSLCEQCHLSGAARIPNPGKTFQDFRAGERIEEVFTVYVYAQDAADHALKVISHPEQLAASMCARKSDGKLWCGTCHDPHNKPRDPVAYYRDRCLSCHTGKLPQTHLKTSDCIGCHMPRRETYDGAHTVFTDHQIARQPQRQSDTRPSDNLIAWREPEGSLAIRNLALANIDVGLQQRSPTMIVNAYRMLTQVQQMFPADPALFNGIGTALLLGGKADEALIAFERVLELQPRDPAAEENVARAYLASGKTDQAIAHLETAVDLDPLSLSAIELLESLYRKAGEFDKESALEERLRRAISH